LAKGALTTKQKEEYEIRKNMINSGLIDCIVNLPPKLFLNTQIPASLWFIKRKKRTRKNEILFIDARDMGKLINRRTRVLTKDDIRKIADTYHLWQAEDKKYEDVKGFCKSVTIEEVKALDYVLTPGRYVGLPDEEDDFDFEERFTNGPDISRFQTSKKDGRMLADRMRNQDDELQMVIVRDMWLTGFDVPMLHTMYIDKPMRGHNLMQAIARVNRVYKDKPGGLIVDYLGIASDLKEALSFYSESGGRGDPAKMQEEAVSVVLEKYEIVSQMFFGFDYKRYFSADTGERLSIILSAQEHILSQENGRNRFIDAVTALSKAMALAIPHEEALRIKEDVAFFQAVKARLVKFSRRGGGRSFEEMELAVKQVIDEAIVAEEIVDVFGAAGLKRPDISVLSEEFLEEVRNMKYKHIALEVLKKLLDDEIKGRRKVNLVKSKSFEEMIEYAIKRYQNKVLTAAEVIEELIKIAKEIKESDKEPEEMGLSGFEYAFYSAVANNGSARELMGKEKLRELAVVLYDKVRKNASIDWTIRENAKAKLRVIVKRTLRQYGYPPDMQKLATETVLKQAELIAEGLTESN